MAADTLPDWLAVQAEKRPAQVAIRHKKLGIWHEQPWHAVHNEVLLAARFLKQQGFASGDTLFLLSEPRPEALLLSLAAHWLGGIAAPLDPAYAQPQLLDLLNTLRPQFVFAEAQTQVDQVFEAKPDFSVLIYANARGLAGYSHPAIHAYTEIISVGEAVPGTLAAVATPASVAFRFYRLGGEYQLEYRELSHTELLKNGRQLVVHEQLTDKEEALAARTFAASGHARYLLSPWLLAGFKLNFPENLSTRDTDRRELGPTLVAGTAATYQRLYALGQSRWPLPKTWQFSLVRWALNNYQKRVPLLATIANWLVIQPLKDVLGLRHTRVPLLVGEPLSAEAEQFFRSIGIEVLDWPEEADWQASALQVIPSPHRHTEYYFAEHYVGVKSLRAAI